MAEYGTLTGPTKPDRWFAQPWVLAPVALVAVCALPLIVGSDCSWAVWIARFMGWDMSQRTFTRLSNTLQFALCLCATTNLVQLVARKSTAGVAWLTVFAGLLLLVHPTVMVLSDLHLARAECVAASGHLTWEFGCTLAGYALLVLAVATAVRTPSRPLSDAVV